MKFSNRFSNADERDDRALADAGDPTDTFMPNDISQGKSTDSGGCCIIADVVAEDTKNALANTISNNNFFNLQ